MERARGKGGGGLARNRSLAAPLWRDKKDSPFCGWQRKRIA